MKKVTKNIISVIMIFSMMLGVFAGCKKEEIKPTEPETTKESVIKESTTELTTETSTVTTTESATKKSEKKTEAVKFLVADKGDKKSFTSFMAYILGYGLSSVSEDPPCGDEGYSEKEYFDYNYKSFNCTDKNAFEYAFDCMLGTSYCGIEEALDEAYNIKYDSYFKEFDEYDEPEPPKDPLKKFVNASMYAKFDGKMFDSILENIFNIKPNHSYVLKGNNENGISVYAYYYEENYYIFRGLGGDGFGPRVIINDMKTQTDGKYKINITYQWGNDSGFDDIARLNVVAGLKNWNNNRIWSLYSVTRM